MELGERIEARIKELGISQAEVARRASIPQTTMNGLIRGGHRSTPHLTKIARALETSPAFLTGETEDPSADAADRPTLSYDQLELIDCYNRLEEAEKAALLQIARLMASKAPPQNKLHDKPVGFRPGPAKSPREK